MEHFLELYIIDQKKELFLSSAKEAMNKGI